MTDEPTPPELEQLAGSVAMSGVLGDRDRLEVVVELRRLAESDKSKRRHPPAGSADSRLSRRSTQRAPPGTSTLRPVVLGNPNRTAMAGRFLTSTVTQP